jgi:hypothetical protein
VLDGKRQFGLGLDLRSARARAASRGRSPFAGWEGLTHPRRHPAASLASAGAHAAILLLALLSPRLERQESSPPQRPPIPRLVYLMKKEVSPKPKPRRPPEPSRLHSPPSTPAFAEAVPPRAPDFPSPSNAPVPDAPEHDEPAALTPNVENPPGDLDRRLETVGDAAAVENPATTEDAMVSEARRLFGRPVHAGGSMAGPVRAGLPVHLARGGTRCPWSGREVEQIDPRGNGVIEGIVRTQSGGRPIPGAFLQLLGSGHAAFADAAGRYRLTFDPALVDVCRSQLVRVTAPGFRARTMVLAYGAQSNNVVDLEVRP